jgi:hypothetical protein
MIELTEDGRIWSEWCETAGIQDVYWTWGHLALWAPEWRAQPLGVRWTGGRETVLQPVLRVPLDRLEGGSGFFDLRTAYDFGGPRHVGVDPAGSMDRFEAEWTECAGGLGIVTEFLRLHPTALSTLPSWATQHAENYLVDLTRSYEEIRRGYHSSWRNALRKGELAALSVEVAGDPEKQMVDSFLNLYGETMSRLGAPARALFKNETLRRFLALPEASLVTVRSPQGEPIAHATILASGPTLFYHLSCSDPVGLPLEPNRRLLDTLVRFGKEQSFRTLHLGGGSPSLRTFKKHMSSGTIPYHVVKRIWDPETYTALCRANGADPEARAFPAYLERLEK